MTVSLAELPLTSLLCLHPTSSLRPSERGETGRWGLQKRRPPCSWEPWSWAEHAVGGGLSSLLSELSPARSGGCGNGGWGTWCSLGPPGSLHAGVTSELRPEGEGGRSQEVKVESWRKGSLEGQGRGTVSAGCTPASAALWSHVHGGLRVCRTGEDGDLRKVMTLSPKCTFT